MCGFIDDDSRNARKTLMEVKVLGTRHDIPQLVQDLGVKEIIVAAEDLSSESLGEIIDICTRCGVKHRMVASVLDLATREIHISKISPRRRLCRSPMQSTPNFSPFRSILT